LALPLLTQRGNLFNIRGKTIMMADDLPLPKEVVKIFYRVLSTNSEWRQGIALRTKGKIKLDDQVITKGWVDIWTDKMPCEEQFICKSKSGILEVRNIWDTGNGCVESWNNGAAMWYEEISNGRRYHCNDGHFDDDFDELIFELTIVPEE
jgi:hypothetical protein